MVISTDVIEASARAYVNALVKVKKMANQSYGPVSAVNSDEVPVVNRQ